MDQVNTAQQPHQTLRRLTSYASVLVATSLIIGKLFAFLATNSVALLSSLVDSGVDLLASLIVAYGVMVAMRPPDRDHRYGHGKAESLSALMQGAFIVVSSGFLIKEAIDRFLSPQPLDNAATGYTIMIFSIVMTAALLALQTYTVRKTNSLAIASDRMHYVGDILVNLAVIATFMVQGHFDVQWVDPLFGLAIAAIMLIGAWKIAKMAFLVLMDAELPEQDRQQILAIATGVAGVCGAHDLRTRMDNGKPIIEIHIEMDPLLPLQHAHDISEAAEQAIRQAYPRAEILIHQDPVGVKETRLDAQIENNDPVSTHV